MQKPSPQSNLEDLLVCLAPKKEAEEDTDHRHALRRALLNAPCWDQRGTVVVGRIVSVTTSLIVGGVGIVMMVMVISFVQLSQAGEGALEGVTIIAPLLQPESVASTEDSLMIGEASSFSPHNNNAPRVQTASAYAMPAQEPSPEVFDLNSMDRTYTEQPTNTATGPVMEHVKLFYQPFAELTIGGR